MIREFEHNIQREGLFSREDRLIIAASGGLDSCVLIELCRQAGYRFTLAHCNFQLRGQESDRDEAFIKSLADRLALTIRVKRFETAEFAREHKLSLQEAARKLRYDWFAELCEEPGSLLLTAHHRDDAIETQLMNFFRGTGLRGLSGIPARNGKIRRPLLPFYREELEQFAREQQVSWVEDSSNLQSDYTRNYLRKELIPAVQKVFPRVRKNLGEQIDRLRGITALYESAVGDIKKRLLRQKGADWMLPAKELLRFNNRALVYEIVRDFGFGEKQLDDVIRLASESSSGSFLVSPDGRFRLIRHRHWLVFSPALDATSEHFLVESPEERIHFAGEILDVEETDVTKAAFGPDPQVAYVNASLLQYPLLLRRWKAGDYFYPLGMEKKKKLSRFFIDQKLSVARKEKAWVIENGDGKILWVVGMRIDNRFRITDSTKRCVRFRVSRD